MKYSIIFLLIWAINLPVYAHPGELDENLCHVCTEEIPEESQEGEEVVLEEETTEEPGCAAWGLTADEFHCHDESGGYINSLGEEFDAEGQKISYLQDAEPEIPDIEDGIAPPLPDQTLGNMPRDLEAEAPAPGPTKEELERINKIIYGSDEEGGTDEKFTNDVGFSEEDIAHTGAIDEGEQATNALQNFVSRATTGQSTGWIFGLIGGLLVLGAVIYLIKVFGKKDDDLD